MLLVLLRFTFDMLQGTSAESSLLMKVLLQ